MVADLRYQRFEAIRVIGSATIGVSSRGVTNAIRQYRLTGVNNIGIPNPYFLFAHSPGIEASEWGNPNFGKFWECQKKQRILYSLSIH